MTVAADGSAACESAYYWIRTFASPTISDVSIVRSYWPPQEAAHYGVEEPWLGNHGHPELLRLIERDLRRDARALAGAEEPQIRFAIAGRNAAEVIAEDMRLLGADAMVIGVPAHRRVASTGLSIASVSRFAPIPVFCIPATAHPTQRHIPKVQSVLIAFDLTEMSRAAILPAYGLLLGGGRAEICYVHERGPAHTLDGQLTRPALTEDERAIVDSRLRAAVPYEAAEHGIVTHTSVTEGLTAAEAILQAAERLDVDVIALGSRGRSGLARTLLGSVAEEVARRSTRPVLTVRGLVQ